MMAAPAAIPLMNDGRMDSWPRGRDVLLAATAAATAAAAAAAAVRDGPPPGDVDIAASVQAVLEKHPLHPDKAMEAVTPNDPEGRQVQSTAFFASVATGDNRYVAQAWAEVYAAALPPVEMSRACTACFSACVGGEPRGLLPGMSVLFAYGADVEPVGLIDLARKLTLSELKDIFLGGVACVDNPFIPGVSLSAAITEALKNAKEAEASTLTALQEILDDLLLEVLDRLPQTIEEFPGGVDGCEAVFEPEKAAVIRDKHFRGPLRLAFQEEHFSETLCISPLVFEYMSHRFVAGLPNIQDSNSLLGRQRKRRASHRQLRTASGRIDSSAPAFASASAPDAAAAAGAISSTERKGKDFLYDDGFVASFAGGRLMQGLGWTGWGAKTTSDRTWEWERVFCGTFLPGAQFALIGILTRPATYYKVAAMRMLLSFYVHLMVLALYTTVVLEDDDGKLSNAELSLMFYVVAEIVNNLLQMWDHLWGYLNDKWNWLELLSLSLLAGGLFIRVVNTDVHFGRALFALSAPLVFSRVLFFGQILQRQGLVIQMMAILVGEMVQFGLVLGTIMMGFTVSFFALFNDTQSYGDVWLDVFKAMLGEVGAFQELYDDKQYETVARLLMVVYLLVVAVMLLNLLIAVLSTEHAKVDEQQDRAFRESKVRIMKVYGRMVEADIIPPPFNLLQLVLRLLLTFVDRISHKDTCPRIMRKFGMGTFWLTLGPPALLTAWGLWAISTPAAVLTVWRRAKFTGVSMTLAIIGSATVVVLHVLLLPFVAAVLWVQSGILLFVSSLKDLAVILGCKVMDDGDVDDRPQRRGGLGASGSGHGGDGGGSGGGGLGASGSGRGGLDASGFGRGSGGSGGGGGGSAAAVAAAAGASIDKMLTRGGGKGVAAGGGGGGLNVAEIRAYLEDPSTTVGLALRQQEKSQAATNEHVTHMRQHLDNAGKKRCDDLRAALAVVDENVRKLVTDAPIEARGAARTAAAGKGLSEDLRSLEERVGALIEEKVTEIVERRMASLETSLTALLTEARFEERPTV